jgi:hypothetical protein
MAGEKIMRAQAVVTDEYRSAFPDPITIKADEIAVVSHCDLEWRGWIWITLPDGKAGWAPEQYFLPLSPNEVVCLEDYRAQELTVHPGEALIVTQALNGWYWAEKPSGENGWVPQECLTLLDR